MKAEGILLVLALLLAPALAVPITATNTVTVEVIGPNGQPIKDMTLYLVRNNQDTTRAIAQNRTDSSGKAVLRADITTDDTYWVVGKAPVIYRGVELTSASDSYFITFHLNDTSAFRNVTLVAILDSLPDSSVRGNLTLRGGSGSVKAVDVPLTLNIIFFPDMPDFDGTLEISRTVRKLGVEYTLVNITVVFRNDTKVGYNATSYDIDPSAVKHIVVFYRSTGTFFGLPLTTWIAVGILLVAAGGFIAIARSRRAAMAVMRERRVLRGADRYVLENGMIDWQSLLNGNIALEERMRKARRALRRA